MPKKIKAGSARKETVEKWIDEYIDYYSIGLADKTKNAYKLQLKLWAEHMFKKSSVLFKGLSAHYKPNSLGTTCRIIMKFHDYCIEQGYLEPPNLFRIYCKRNLTGRHSKFKPTIPQISFEEAVEKINTIPEADLRNKALQLLYGGLRFEESFTYDPETGYVIGKRSKHRKVNIPKKLQHIEFAKISRRRSLQRRLKERGLTPHDLRKICATMLARNVDMQTVKEYFGWENLATANHYVRGLEFDQVKAKMEKLFPEVKVSNKDFEGSETDAS